MSDAAAGGERVRADPGSAAAGAASGAAPGTPPRPHPGAGLAAAASHPVAAVPGILGAMTTPDESVRPWGSYEVLLDEADHKVKQITVAPGKRLSYQRHSRRSEHWFVVRGTGAITLDGVDTPLSAGASVDVPVGVAHRMTCTGDEPLVFVEVQHGDYFGEDDIERLEDDFGRAG